MFEIQVKKYIRKKDKEGNPLSFHYRINLTKKDIEKYNLNIEPQYITIMNIDEYKSLKHQITDLQLTISEKDIEITQLQNQLQENKKNMLKIEDLKNEILSDLKKELNTNKETIKEINISNNENINQLNTTHNNEKENLIVIVNGLLNRLETINKRNLLERVRNKDKDSTSKLIQDNKNKLKKLPPSKTYKMEEK